MSDKKQPPPDSSDKQPLQQGPPRWVRSWTKSASSHLAGGFSSRRECRGNHFKDRRAETVETTIGMCRAKDGGG